MSTKKPQYPLRSPGAPSKVTDAVTDSICAYIELNWSLEDAAIESGITYETLRVHRRDNPEFAARIAEAQKIAALNEAELLQETLKANLRTRYKSARLVEKVVEGADADVERAKFRGSDYVNLSREERSGTQVNIQNNTNVDANRPVFNFNILPQQRDKVEAKFAEIEAKVIAGEEIDDDYEFECESKDK